MQTIIMLVVGLADAVFGLFGVSIGLTDKVNGAGIIGGLLLVAVWLFTTGRQDIKNFINGVITTGRWGDPSFYVSLIAAIMVPITTNFPGVTLGDTWIGVISVVLSVLVPFLISKFNKVEPAPVEMLRHFANNKPWKLAR